VVHGQYLSLHRWKALLPKLLNQVVSLKDAALGNPIGLDFKSVVIAGGCHSLSRHGSLVMARGQLPYSFNAVQRGRDVISKRRARSIAVLDAMATAEGASVHVAYTSPQRMLASARMARKS